MATLGVSESKPCPSLHPDKPQSKRTAIIISAALLLIFIFPSFLDLWNPYSDGCADIELAVNRDSVFIAEINFEPVVDIFNADAL